MNQTWIVVRIPGFYARVERRFFAVQREKPLLVCVGAGSRAFVLSAEEGAAEQGVRPGMRLGELDATRFFIVSATPSKYRDAENSVLAVLGRVLPDVQFFRPGVFASRWEGGMRFLGEAVSEARAGIASLGYSGGWGIAPEAAAAEIAASVARSGSIQWVPPQGIRTYLAPLPLNLLHDLTVRHLELFREMGIHTFSDLATLPADALRRMLGREGPALLEIALHGRRREVKREWRGQKRLGEDVADPGLVRKAVAELIASGCHAFAALHKSPGLLRLTLVYTDRRVASGVVPGQGKEHEGQWLQGALQLVDRLWTRRVRIAQVRLTLTYGPAETGQLRLFVPPERQDRERRLTDALGHLRTRWGLGAVRFAAAFAPTAGGTG